jgi:Cu+-exporting ATPase
MRIHFIKGKASEAIRKLNGSSTPLAKVLREDQEFEVPVEQVQVGEIVVVRPGERISVEGIVIEGCSSGGSTDCNW